MQRFASDDGPTFSTVAKLVEALNRAIPTSRWLSHLMTLGRRSAAFTSATLATSRVQLR
jgi:hypothetical protein